MGSENLFPAITGKYTARLLPKQENITGGGLTKSLSRIKRMLNKKPSDCGIRIMPRLSARNVRINQASSAKKVSPLRKSVHCYMTSPACNAMLTDASVFPPRRHLG